MKTWVTYLVVTGAMAAVLFVALELAARSLAGSERPFVTDILATESAEAYRGLDWAPELFAELRQRYGERFAWKPYVPFSLWKDRPFHGRLFNVGDDGYRVTLPPTATDRTVRHVFLYGGSTMFAAQVPDALTIPSLLKQRLEARHADWTWDVRNYGIDSFTSDQEAVLLLEQITEGNVPDLAIFYDGVNDVFVKILVGEPHGFYDRFVHVVDRRRQIADIARALARKLALVRLFDGGPTLVDDPGLFRERSRQMTARYRGTVTAIRAMLSARPGASAVFVWQPTLFSTSKRVAPDEARIRGEQPPALAHAFAEADRVAQETLIDPDIVRDFRGALDGITEAVFVDFCHVTSPANAAIADRLVGIVEEKLRPAAGGE